MPIVADGPAAYWSSLPVKAIAAQLRKAGIPASVSGTRRGRSYAIICSMGCGI